MYTISTMSNMESSKMDSGFDLVNLNFASIDVLDPSQRSILISRCSTELTSSPALSLSIVSSFEVANTSPTSNHPDLFTWLVSVTSTASTQILSPESIHDEHRSTYGAADWQPYHDYYLLSHHWPYLSGSERLRDINGLDELRQGLAMDMSMVVDIDWLQYRLAWVGHHRLLWPKEWVLCRRVMDWLENIAEAVDTD